MSIRLDGQVAIVTGAGQGLGRTHALALAERGAKIVVNDLGGARDGTGNSNAAAQSVVEEIQAAGGEAMANGANVADPEQVRAMVASVMDYWGRVDILVNNAGILRDKSFLKMPLEDFRAVLDVHLIGTVNCTHAVWPIMREQAYGRILFTSSSSGIFGNFGQSNYGAAKTGMIGLMNVLKLEGSKSGVKVNAIAPIALTRMTEDVFGEFMAAFDPEAVSPVVAYFASEECSVSGEIWSVGGGQVSRFFVALAHGYFKHPGRDGRLTIEDIVDNLEDIRSEDGYIVPYSSQDEFAKLGPLLLG